MRRLLLICILLQLALLPLHAQRGTWLRKAGKAALTDGNYSIAQKGIISYQLSRRVKQSFHTATQTLHHIPPGMQSSLGRPTRRARNVQDMDFKEIYPDIAFLTTSGQTANYLLSRNNRLLSREQKRMEKVLEQIDIYLPLLTRQAQQLKQPDNPLEWLADEIPLGTQQLFIGEAHGYPEIREAVRQLLTTIRDKQPRREIFLFTEFIPENVIWEDINNQNLRPPYLPNYYSVWDSAVETGIHVIGLEPKPVVQAVKNNSCTCSYLDSTGTLQNMYIWATLEGLRWRNERWLKTLTAYRTQYPDALFIIYTGADHTLYNRPFSLAAGFPKENTFLAVVYPDKKSIFIPSDKWYGASLLTDKPYADPIETLHEQADFPQPALKWSTPELSQIAGFDARIKIPVKLPEMDY